MSRKLNTRLHKTVRIYEHRMRTSGGPIRREVHAFPDIREKWSGALLLMKQCSYPIVGLGSEEGAMVVHFLAGGGPA